MLDSRDLLRLFRGKHALAEVQKSLLDVYEIDSLRSDPGGCDSEQCRQTLNEKLQRPIEEFRGHQPDALLPDPILVLYWTRKELDGLVK